MRERRLSDVYLVEWKADLHKVEYEMEYGYSTDTVEKRIRKRYYSEEHEKKYFTLDPSEKLIGTLYERIRKEYEYREDVEVVQCITITSIKPL